MAPLAKLKLRSGFGSTRNLGSRTQSNEFADFDGLECPNSFEDDPTLDDFFEQREADGLVAGLVKPPVPLLPKQVQQLRPQPQPPNRSKVPLKDQTQLKSTYKPVLRSNSCISAKSSTVLNKSCTSNSSNPSESAVVSQDESSAKPRRTTAAALAESARKGIQRRSQSLREKIMPRRPVSVKTLPEQDEAEVDDANGTIVPMTPMVPLVRPNTPPRSRIRRLGPPGPGNTLVNPQGLIKGTVDELPKQATHGYRVIPQPKIPEQKLLNRHVMRRWSMPMAQALTETISPEEEGEKVAATPLHTRPAPRKRKTLPKQNDSKKTGSTPKTPMVRASSLMVITPKRKKSLVKGVRIQFDHRDSLRKLSLTRTMIVSKQPVLPSKKKPVVSKTRNPYAHIKSKVGEVFRSVLPKREVSSITKDTLNVSKLNSTVASSCSNTSVVSTSGLSTSIVAGSSLKKRPPSKARRSPSPSSSLNSSGTHANPNPPGKTLAQLVKDFHRTPPRFRSRPIDNRIIKKTKI